MKAWYFSTVEKKLRYGDGREIALGITHTVGGKPTPCERGLHGSVRLIDALKYAPSPIVWEVELGGEVVEDVNHDKYAATERTYLRGGIDISETLRAFSRWAALSVANLWDMPDVVRQYLETGDASLTKAAADTAAYAADAAAPSAADSARAAACSAAYAAYAEASSLAIAYAIHFASSSSISFAAKKEELNRKLTEMVKAAITQAESEHAKEAKE